MINQVTRRKVIILLCGYLVEKHSGQVKQIASLVSVTLLRTLAPSLKIKAITWTSAQTVTMAGVVVEHFVVFSTHLDCHHRICNGSYSTRCASASMDRSTSISHRHKYKHHPSLAKKSYAQSFMPPASFGENMPVYAPRSILSLPLNIIISRAYKPSTWDWEIHFCLTKTAKKKNTNNSTLK